MAPRGDALGFRAIAYPEATLLGAFHAQRVGACAGRSAADARCAGRRHPPSALKPEASVRGPAEPSLVRRQQLIDPPSPRNLPGRMPFRGASSLMRHFRAAFGTNEAVRNG
jgi:hypothetical protein